MKQFFGLFFIQAIEFETKLKIIDRKKKKNQLITKTQRTKNSIYKKSKQNQSISIRFIRFFNSIRLPFKENRTEANSAQLDKKPNQT